MSTQLYRLWQQVLDRLSTLADVVVNGGNVSNSDWEKVGHLVGQLGRLTQQPAAVWTTLIHDMQVGRGCESTSHLNCTWFQSVHRLGC
jgi:hypothetical protein